MEYLTHTFGGFIVYVIFLFGAIKIYKYLDSSIKKDFSEYSKLIRILFKIILIFIFFIGFLWFFNLNEIYAIDY